MNDEEKQATLEFMDQTEFAEGFRIGRKHKNCEAYKQILERQKAMMEQIWLEMQKHDRECDLA